MQIGVAEARRRFKEVLAEVDAGGTVEITRRGEVVAVIGPPGAEGASEPWSRALDAWRAEFDVASWEDDDPFGDLRDASPGREPW